MTSRFNDDLPPARWSSLDSTAEYEGLPENDFQNTIDHPLSTFSIDVDTASYSVVRRFLNQGQLPPPEAVRIEELINYFSYDDPAPRGEHPVAVRVETGPCPWNSDSRLIRIGMKGAIAAVESQPPSNLVFLLDVSGSMKPVNRLPLLQSAMQALVRNLSETDRVGIVTFADASKEVLPSTSIKEKNLILSQIEKLQSGGSTNGADGLNLAYAMAEKNFLQHGNNRIILATDGDFNVDETEKEKLLDRIAGYAQKGIFLTVLGFGDDNFKDSRLEYLADKGNGNYAYIDNFQEARKVLLAQAQQTLVAVAKDVKIQIEFNPRTVGSYRLIGYENRRLENKDFKDDAKDAGELGSGQSLTVLYEYRDPVKTPQQMALEKLKYQQTPKEPTFVPTELAESGELCTLEIRYKEVDEKKSRTFSVPVKDSQLSMNETSRDFRFSAAVASFGMLLRGSKYAGIAFFDFVIELAQDGIEADPDGSRAEFIQLVRTAKALKK